MIDVPNDTQHVLLDNDERLVINAYRRVRSSEFADVILKIHRRKLSAIYITDKWHAEHRNAALREQNGGGE